MIRKLAYCLTLLFLFTGPGVFAQSDATWMVDDGDFLEPTNWDISMVPGNVDRAIINNGGTATIGADSGEKSLGSILMGTDGEQSGHIVMLGGTWDMSREPDSSKAEIGKRSTVESSFIMLGGTILYDGPEAFPGARGEDGLNGNDWEIGEDGVGPLAADEALGEPFEVGHRRRAPPRPHAGALSGLAEDLDEKRRLDALDGALTGAQRNRHVRPDIGKQAPEQAVGNVVQSAQAEQHVGL